MEAGEELLVGASITPRDFYTEVTSVVLPETVYLDGPFTIRVYIKLKKVYTSDSTSSFGCWTKVEGFLTALELRYSHNGSDEVRLPDALWSEAELSDGVTLVWERQALITDLIPDAEPGKTYDINFLPYGHLEAYVSGGGAWPWCDKYPPRLWGFLTDWYQGGGQLESISVKERPPYPVFKECWAPDHVDADEPFTPIITLENPGGTGAVFVEAYTAEGGTKTLISSVELESQAEYGCPIEAHPISWYLGYTPTQSQYVNIKFSTGPVGMDPTDECTETILVTVDPAPPCIEGETKCVGYNLYQCVNESWQLKEENSAACGYSPPGPPAKTGVWPFVLGGIVLLGSAGGYVMLRRRK